VELTTNPAPESRSQQFVEKMGLLFEADGAARIAGRIFGSLLLSPEPLSLDELATRLQVSKASVSTNARVLEHFGAVQRVSKLGDRRDYYEVAPDVHRRVLELRLTHLRRTRDLLEEGCRELACCDPAVQARLESLEAFFRHMVTEAAQAMGAWEDGAADAARRGSSGDEDGRRAPTVQVRAG
jgi:DNA-binding transcriptional regulator GbsR (MarR family)